MTASEWLLYNILDLKFIQGKPVREIADRLSMSESDLYRKQRVAIEQVALKIAELEAGNGVEEKTPESTAVESAPSDTANGPSTLSTKKTNVAEVEASVNRR